MSGPRDFQTIYGVDFSGAKLAGRNTWVARLERRLGGRYGLTALDRLERLAGDASRGPALAHLAGMIAGSSDALWAMDFPFALPIEVTPRQRTFDDQLEAVRRWRGEAYALGLRCVERTRRIHARKTVQPSAKLHIRRLTDIDTKTPFDCYHYRIIYQTFHGMRDVLLPLREHRGRVAILPFDYAKLARASAVCVESCPASFLKRAGWPHNNYKQATGGPLTPIRRRNRREILGRVAEVVGLCEGDVRRMMRDPGADALDAVLAAVGAMRRWGEVNHRAVARHVRYRREGFVYA
jgi:hypothetical protein